jgi:hypothetical protein
MYQLNVLQNQWLILALFGGVFLAIGLVSAYMMMWRPRIESPQPLSGGRTLIRWIPWFLFALLISIVIFQFIYAIVLHFYPPNM